MKVKKGFCTSVCAPVIATIRTGISGVDTRLDNWGSKLEQKKFNIYPSIIGSVLFIGLSVTILVLMPSQIKVQPNQSITPRTFPALLAYIMLGCALLTFGKDVLKFIRKQPVPKVTLSALVEVKACILLVLMLGYGLLMPVIGFIASSVLYGVAMLCYFRVKRWYYYPLVVVCAFLIGYLFKYVLYVRLP